ncbi:protein phosphatase 2C domain-containing protein [Streptomyces mexicanus]|uniref:protein phosphatase 2C domain-containing protein n=2 Tax=Streptomyces mexicanus TaxID=178566 RepID=UPI0036B0160C
MSQQGGRPTGPGEDWWGRLYDSTGDTGPTAAADSLDDRFASASGTLRAPADAPAAEDGAGERAAAWAGDRSRGPGEGWSEDGDEGGGDEAEGRGGETTGDPVEDRIPPWVRPAAEGPTVPAPRSAAGDGRPDEAPDGPPAPRPTETAGTPDWWRRPPAPPEPPAQPERPAPPARPTRLPEPTAFAPAARPPDPAAPPADSAPTTADPAPGVPNRDTPGTDTPGTDTPGTDTPGTDTPGTDTCDTGTPETDTPRTGLPTQDTVTQDTPTRVIPPRPVSPPAPHAPPDLPAGTAARPTTTPPTTAPPGAEADDTPTLHVTPTTTTTPTSTPTPVPRVTHVGSRPPTYDGEPTALPAADPDGLEELVPDTVLDGARYGGRTVRAVSLRGDSPRYRGEPRRDALLTARFGAGERALVLVAMATGARGAPGAHRAAAEVCRWLARSVGRSHARLVEDIRGGRRGELKAGLHRLTDRGLGSLRAGAVEQGVDPAEYTATVRCLLLPADPACPARVFFGVGSGGLFRLRDGVWQDLEPEDTEPSTPAPTPAAFRFRASLARPGDTLLMCTGGLADPLRGEAELRAHLARRWSGAAPPGLAAFLADVQTRAKGYADDRTAVAVWEA